MRIVHSFSSKRCDEALFRLHIVYFALSCIYAKRSGFEMALHCDNKTKDVLEAAPYDEIITDLENIPDFPKRLFAYPKFIAMQDEPLGTIHIDGDVFLKSVQLNDILNFKDYDCIVQNIERPVYPWGHLWKESAIAFSNCNYPDWAKRQCNDMYNCGTIGFNNQELKDEYFSTYWQMVEEYKKKGIDLHSVPDLVIEQQFLKDLTDYRKCSVKRVLDFNDLGGSASRIGYQHVIGGAKQECLEKALNLIKHYDINTYNKLMEYDYIRQ